MTGRVTPGFEINDNPGTTGRSVGYGADFTSWVQESPNSLKLQNLPSASRASPGFAEGRSVGYGADLPDQVTSLYPGPLKGKVSMPVVGVISVGTILIAIFAAYLVIKKF